MQLLLKRILYIAILPFLLFACASTPTDSSVKTEDFSKKTAVTYDRQREQTAFVELETGIEQTNQENRPQLISQNNTVIPVEKYQPYVKIKEIGYGATVNEARRDALENLVSSIQINVLKLVKLCTNDFGDCGSVVKVNTQSELPIMGAHYQRLNSAQNNEKFLVWIDSKSSLPIYVRDLDRLSSQITKALGILETLKPASQRYRVIDELLGLILQYDKKQIG
jgi:hypothetical protein